MLVIRLRGPLRSALSKLLLGERSKRATCTATILCVSVWLSGGVQEFMCNDSEQFDGVYEFIQDEVRIQEPDLKTTTRNGADLACLMIFKDGYYSETLMKKTRSKWVSRFPGNATELGYSSTAGTYEVLGKILERKFVLVSQLCRKTSVARVSEEG